MAPSCVWGQFMNCPLQAPNGRLSLIGVALFGVGYNEVMRKTKAGFQEIDHTADWALRAWAPDLPGLFEQAALGMYSLMDTRLAGGERVRRELSFEALDRESLLVVFLGELLYLDEVEGLAFDQFSIRVGEESLAVTAEGAEVGGQTRIIKAVTYHALAIEAVSGGYQVQVVFDV